MDMWISLPSSAIPEVSTSPCTEDADSWYQRICSAFAHSAGSSADTLVLPCAIQMDTEDLAASAIRQMLKSEEGSAPLAVDMLVDCRSSAAIGGSAPTYKLAAKADLQKSLPFCLTGQAGSEVIQALTFVQSMAWNESNGVVISAVQRVVPPDARAWPTRFPLGDAAASIVVTRKPRAFGPSFRLLSAAAIQSEDGQSGAFETVLNRAMEAARVAAPNIKWAVAHRLSEEFDIAVQRTLPNATWFTRDLYPAVDFGCADSLISLRWVFTTGVAPPLGVGTLWFGGRFGAVGVVLLDSSSNAV